jgi:hypothetical protein
MNSDHIDHTILIRIVKIILEQNQKLKSILISKVKEL